MELQTEIKYCYKDDKGRTVHKKAILYHPITQSYKQTIFDSLYRGKFFIASLIGLPCDKKTGFGESQDIAGDPWFMLESIRRVEAKETVLLTAEQAANRFQALAGHWEEKLTPDYVESRWLTLIDQIPEH